MPYKRIAENIRAIMACEAIPPKLLASRIGCHYSFITSILRGQAKPTFATVARLAVCLNVSLCDLFSPCPVRWKQNTHPGIRHIELLMGRIAHAYRAAARASLAGFAHHAPDRPVRHPNSSRPGHASR